MVINMTKIYMIGNTHFDPVWEWKWDEAMASIRATFRSALDRMKEYPNFCYSFSSPPVFEWIKKTDAEMFEEIKMRIDEGRWDLCEGWYNQPDCFSAMGESYARQGLYGQRYLQKNFGRYAECAFNTDSFGHPDMLPQILSKSGIKYYCLCRPEEKHYHLESPLFRWKSSDGSEILTFRIGGSAGEGWAKDTAKNMKSADISGCDILMVYGVTDHGGAPTKKSIEEIIASDIADFSTVSGYFNAQKNIQEEIHGEFITGDFGVYSNNASVKQMNRIAEYSLLNAEKSCVIAKNPLQDKLVECWHDVLFNQFHDILGGASIKEAYTDARNLHGRAIQTANEIMHFNLQKVAANIQMPGKNSENEWNLVIWNLNCCGFDGYIEAEVQWAHEFEWYDGGIVLEDKDGRRIETQIIEEHSAIPKFRSRFIFKADLYPLGYKCYKVIKNNINQKKQLLTDCGVIETKRYTYTISEQDGSIVQIFDKNKKCIEANNLFVPNCYEDNGDTWCFNIDSYGKLLGGFTAVKSELVEYGELFDKLKITLTYNNSLLYLYYKFYNNEDYFDVEYVVNWNEKHTVFKFNCDTDDKAVDVSTPYSHMMRGKSDKDRPMGEWLETEKLLFLTGSIFAYNFQDNTIGFTVLRSPIYGDFRLGELEEKDYMITEQGITGGSMRVLLKNKRYFQSEEAMRFNNRPVVVCESNHSGRCEQTDSYVSLKAANAVISTVKYAENDDGTVVRIVDFSGEEQTAVMSLFGKEYSISLKANEIKTLKLSNGVLTEVNILEERDK